MADHYVTHKGLVLKSGRILEMTTYFSSGYGPRRNAAEFARRSWFFGVSLNNGERGYEAGFAELEVGKLLSWLGVRFRFNEPTGQPRSDFDLHVIFKNGRAGYGEIKAKQKIWDHSPKRRCSIRYMPPEGNFRTISLGWCS